MKNLSLEEKASLLNNSILGANDGIVTTFAIITGSVGAHLPSYIVIVLGLSKLFADAASMASGVYLGLKSEVDYDVKLSKVHKDHSLFRHGIITFFVFVAAGIIPLIPYLFNVNYQFIISAVLVFMELFIIGGLRTRNTKRKWISGAVEMFVVGGVTAIIAYFVGFLAENYLV
jgi:VIT1/CCC1 family predicted Fe2+/Mn2+ transporter